VGQQSQGSLHYMQREQKACTEHYNEIRISFTVMKFCLHISKTAAARRRLALGGIFKAETKQC
jgi:hypothetical protein